RDSLKGSGVGTCSTQALLEVDYEVEPPQDRGFEEELLFAHDREEWSVREPLKYRGDSNMPALRVGAAIEEDAYESMSFRDAITCEIYRTESGNTLRVLRFRFFNGMSVQILLRGHSKLSLDSRKLYVYVGSDRTLYAVAGQLKERRLKERRVRGHVYAVESYEYQVVYMRPHIASTNVGMLGGFDRGLQMFHELSEFDEAKRSCRRRLAGHNERRRKNSMEYKGTGKELVCVQNDDRGRFQLAIQENSTYLQTR
nr:SBP-like protein [Tanacetum cinerariifolium]